MSVAGWPPIGLQAHAPAAGRALLIADLHLDTASLPTLQAALQAFDAAQRFDALWILGDLFEAWIGDDAGLADPLGRRVADALAALANGGTDVHLMLGNRDFLLGEAFASAAGATLHREDECIVQLGGQPLLLMHGDTLCTGDKDYQRLRRQLRDTAWQADFLALSVAARLDAARQLRQASRDAGGRKAQDIMDVAPDAVRERLLAARRRAHGVGTMVHGHTHRPAAHVLTLPSGDTAQRLVLGDWHADGGQAIVVDAAGIRPVRCPAGIRSPCRESDPAPRR